MTHPAGLILIAGSTIFLVGAAIGVPRVFMTPEPEARLRMLHESLRRWRFAQPLYALGPLVASVGVGVLSAKADAGAARTLFALAAVALLVGAVAWWWSTYQRAVRIEDFAFGRLPAWPFVTYVALTIAGLGFLGPGLLASDAPGWIGWLAIGADALFLVAYVGFRDIPPFVFYILLLVVGCGLL